MDTNGTKDGANDATDKVVGVVGNALGEASNAVAGQVGDLSVKAQQLYADATTLVRDRTVERPLAALGIALLAGFFVGVIWSGSGGTSKRGTATRRPDRSQANDY